MLSVIIAMHLLVQCFHQSFVKLEDIESSSAEEEKSSAVSARDTDGYEADTELDTADSQGSHASHCQYTSLSAQFIQRNHCQHSSVHSYK